MLPQVIADVFDMDVYVLESTANSASLGGAYRAKHGEHTRHSHWACLMEHAAALMQPGTQYSEAVRDAPTPSLAVSARPHLHQQAS